MRLLVTGTKEFSRFWKSLAARGETGHTRVEGPVRNILQAIKTEGDEALLRLTAKYDGWNPSVHSLRVSKGEIRRALKSLPPEEKEALEIAAQRIEAFHVLESQQSWLYAEDDGTILGQLIRPLDRVGIYVPGGKASYPSTVLMNAVPARVAGVREIIMSCPAPGGTLNPAVLAAAAIAGVNEIFKIGGAQAIGALAFGTKIIPKVDKIVGPGNIFVATAKRMVFGEVSIDSIAGPSEILVLSDGSGSPPCLAADLLSQAEHDEQAAAILLCTSKNFAERVQREITHQASELSRKSIALKSLRNFGAVVMVRSLAEAVQIINEVAPEHLELAVKDPWLLLDKIQNAGAIFLGPFSPEPIGDYVAGPNHVLPTGGTARFSSPLGVYDFLKRSSVICLSPDGFRNLSPPAMRLARMENLEAHRRSMERRQIL